MNIQIEVRCLYVAGSQAVLVAVGKGLGDFTTCGVNVKDSM